MLLACLWMNGCESTNYYESEGCLVFDTISAHVNDDPYTKEQIREHNVRYMALCD